MSKPDPTGTNNEGEKAMYELAKIIPISDAAYRQEQDDDLAILEAQSFLGRYVHEEGRFVLFHGDRVVATIRVDVEAITKVEGNGRADVRRAVGRS